MEGYNLTGIVQNTTGILSFTQGVNEVLIIGFILSVLLKAMDLVPDLTVYVTLAMWAGFIAFTWKR